VVAEQPAEEPHGSPPSCEGATVRAVGEGVPCATFLRSPSALAGLRTQTVDLLGCLRLVQIGRDLLTGLPGEGVEVAALRARHRLVAGDPVARVLLGARTLRAAQRLLVVVAHASDARTGVRMSAEWGD